MPNLLRRLLNWEQWPFKLIYAPLTPVWLWYIARSGTPWFFTPSNPKLTFGGMEGEGKSEMYALLPPGTFPATLLIKAGLPLDELHQKMEGRGMSFPLIVKPDIGGQGVLFRKLNSLSELEYYHQRVPADYLVQQLVTYPMEVSVFYIRHPESAHGEVTGFLHKIPMQVQGDGLSTLEDLAMRHPKASTRIEELKPRHKKQWNQVIPDGETYMLSYAANHNRGGQFIDLKAHIDDRLVAVFDRISLGVNDFFYGRYDIMCLDIESLKNGRDFSILEYNGCGAEPNHIYDTGYSLGAAYREILKHWKALFLISRYNARKGIKPWPWLKGEHFLRHAKKFQRMLKKVDQQIP